LMAMLDPANPAELAPETLRLAGIVTAPPTRLYPWR
jgi:hypothetical protein